MSWRKKKRIYDGHNVSGPEDEYTCSLCNCYRNFSGASNKREIFIEMEILFVALSYDSIAFTG